MVTLKCIFYSMNVISCGYSLKFDSWSVAFSLNSLLTIQSIAAALYDLVWDKMACSLQFVIFMSFFTSVRACMRVCVFRGGIF